MKDKDDTKVKKIDTSNESILKQHFFEIKHSDINLIVTNNNNTYNDKEPNNKNPFPFFSFLIGLAAIATFIVTLLMYLKM